jgi:hypothetical protein
VCVRACVCVGVRAWLQNVPCMRGHTCEALCTTHSRKCRKSRKPPNPAPWGRPDVQGRTREQAPSSCAPVARLATALSPGCSAELCCHRCQRQPARHATRRGNAPAQIAGSCLLAEIRSYRAGPSGRAISGKPCAVALQVAGCVLDVALCMWHVAWHVCSHRPRMARNELRETERICIPNTHCEVVRAAHHLPGAQPERGPCQTHAAQAAPLSNITAYARQR